MRIYTHVVIDMTSGQELEAEYYEYDGPVACCGGGGNDAPATQTQTQSIDPRLFPYYQNLAQQATMQYNAVRPDWYNFDTTADMSPATQSALTRMQQLGMHGSSVTNQGTHTALQAMLGHAPGQGTLNQLAVQGDPLQRQLLTDIGLGRGVGSPTGTGTLDQMARGDLSLPGAGMLAQTSWGQYQNPADQAQAQAAQGRFGDAASQGLAATAAGQATHPMDQALANTALGRSQNPQDILTAQAAGGQFGDAASQGLGQVAAGQYQNPADLTTLKAAQGGFMGAAPFMQAYGNDIQDTINAQFARAGRTYSGGHARALAEGLGESAGKLYSEQQGQQLAAAQALGSRSQAAGQFLGSQAANARDVLGQRGFDAANVLGQRGQAAGQFLSGQSAQARQDLGQRGLAAGTTLYDQALRASLGLNDQAGQATSQRLQALSQMTDIQRAQAAAAGQLGDQALRGVALSPAMNQANLQNLGLLTQAGQMQDAYAQNDINARMAQWDLYQNRPTQALNQYASILYGQPQWGSNQTTTTGGAGSQTNPWATAAGGAMAGSAGGPWGALAGGTAGLLYGLWG